MTDFEGKAFGNWGLTNIEAHRVIASELYGFASYVENITWELLLQATANEKKEIYKKMSEKMAEYIEKINDDFFIQIFEDEEIRTQFFPN